MPSRLPAVCVRRGRAGRTRSLPRSTGLRPRPMPRRSPCRPALHEAADNACLMGRVENLEADRPHAPANRVRRSEEPRRFGVTVGFSGHVGETLENVWNEKVTADIGGDAERFMGVAFSVFAARHPRFRRGNASPAPTTNRRPSSSTRPRRPTGGRRLDRRTQRGLGRPDDEDPRCHGLPAGASPCRLTRLPRCIGVAGGQARDGDPPEEAKS